MRVTPLACYFSSYFSLYKSLCTPLLLLWAICFYDTEYKYLHRSCFFYKKYHCCCLVIFQLSPLSQNLLCYITATFSVYFDNTKYNFYVKTDFILAIIAIKTVRADKIARTCGV